MFSSAEVTFPLPLSADASIFTSFALESSVRPSSSRSASTYDAPEVVVASVDMVNEMKCEFAVVAVDEKNAVWVFGLVWLNVCAG